MSGRPAPYLDPPPEPRTVECDSCSADVPRAEAYCLRGRDLCLDCSAELALDVIPGTPREISEYDLQMMFVALANWLGARQAALLSDSAAALRAAYRAQPRRST